MVEEGQASKRHVSVFTVLHACRLQKIPLSRSSYVLGRVGFDFILLAPLITGISNMWNVGVRKRKDGTDDA